jgi:hypothetical protein
MNYNTLFENELRQLISEEIARVSDNMANGLSINDIAQYKHEVGRLNGLRAALNMCEEVNSILSKR